MAGICACMSRAARSARSGAGRGREASWATGPADATGMGRAARGDAGSAGPSPAPQRGQKAKSGGDDVPQDPHSAATLRPHFGQNANSAATSKPQPAQPGLIIATLVWPLWPVNRARALGRIGATELRRVKAPDSGEPVRQLLRLVLMVYAGTLAPACDFRPACALSLPA